MPRDFAPAQLSNIDAAATRPVYLVAWEHSGVEELIACTGGQVVFDGQTYEPGDLRITAIENGRAARLTMPSTPTRSTQTQNGAWRDGSCKIYYIPSVPDEDLSFVSGDAVAVLDGEIRSSSLVGESIIVVVEHIGAGARISPRYTFDAVCNHLPPAGTVISWEGDTIVLGAPR